MAAKTSTMELLHETLAQVLLERLGSESVSAADMAVVRQFLKDNGIEAVRTPGSGLDKLVNKLPFASPAQLAEEDGIIN